jgi:hypothetical protein
MVLIGSVTSRNVTMVLIGSVTSRNVTLVELHFIDNICQIFEDFLKLFQSEICGGKKKRKKRKDTDPECH